MLLQIATGREGRPLLAKERLSQLQNLKQMQRQRVVLEEEKELPRRDLSPSQQLVRPRLRLRSLI